MRVQVVVALVLLLLSAPCLAEETSAQLAKRSAQLLKDAQHQEAISSLEASADQGKRHPDLSFNRALAYLARAQSPLAQPGDWGQAAAGFEEALLMRPDDAEAQRGLEETQLAVSRVRASGDGATVAEPLGLMERALLSLSPLVLFFFAAMGSIGLSVGLLIRLRGKESHQVSGAIVAGISALILVTGGGLYHARAMLFDDSHVAVVVASQAPILMESGKTLKGAEPLLESTVVHVGSARRGLVPIVGLSGTQYLRTSQLRIVGSQ